MPTLFKTETNQYVDLDQTVIFDLHYVDDGAHTVKCTLANGVGVYVPVETMVELYPGVDWMPEKPRE